MLVPTRVVGHGIVYDNISCLHFVVPSPPRGRRPNNRAHRVQGTTGPWLHLPLPACQASVLTELLLCVLVCLAFISISSDLPRGSDPRPARWLAVPCCKVKTTNRNEILCVDLSHSLLPRPLSVRPHSVFSPSLKIPVTLRTLSSSLDITFVTSRLSFLCVVDLALSSFTDA